VSVGVRVNVGRGVLVGTDVAVELGSTVAEGKAVGISFCPEHDTRIMQIISESKNVLFIILFCNEPANGWRYPLVGGTR
jgi:hypothetical protein